MDIDTFIMNFEQARFNMVEQQVRPWDVLDPTVLDLLNTLPREDFVPTQYRKLAYSDTPIPLNDNASMLVPREVGRILQALQPQSNDLVLEIGTGSGYLTACLSLLSAHVLSIEIDHDLHNNAKANLSHHKRDNVTLLEGDGSMGWAEEGPYNLIVVTASLPILPENLLENLHVGGRLFAVQGESPVMEATLVTRVGHEKWHYELLYETDIPALKNAKHPSSFTL